MNPLNSMNAVPVFVAGIGNSGPEHWQTLWHAELAHSVWVEHSSWDAPVRDVWVRELDEALRAVDGPKVLVAHSLGCTLVTEWAAQHKDEGVVAALLVAMPDVHGPVFPGEAVGFDTPELHDLPFRTVLVASQDDPYGAFAHAEGAAATLGAELVDVGALGHINSLSGLGRWTQGRALLDALLTARRGADD
ncbi:RBBP9/YdeN family alpha/beta hydrolase [Cellulomonas chengniuliangii]|uniref:Alpha/beta hydrolase n=1 Tax=Cellulomonas chengniuliangii TaxID=2968084 RepID=A0ABY5L3Y0_9CELL|nr:alpha/beta hydrolase [Cellulomonas chengniuliangii]MCC2308114.1 alpha/beta hydrolase [Cellulomonas chengniuliangii]UUI76509.1 alpha/beta hydrolase [Cellulomonas chengniuliangii]